MSTPTTFDDILMNESHQEDLIDLLEAVDDTATDFMFGIHTTNYLIDHNDFYKE